MSDNPISCAPRIDTFLVYAETYPYELEEPRTTIEEKNRAREAAIKAVDDSDRIVFDLSNESFDDKTRKSDEIVSQNEQNENIQSDIVEEHSLRLHP